MSEEFLDTSSDNIGILEEMYERYKANPSSVDSSWLPLFEHLQQDQKPASFISHAHTEHTPDDIRVYHLIQAYRQFGHLYAQVNPISTQSPAKPRQLNLKNLGFSEDELQLSFKTFGLMSEKEAPLKAIIDTLKNIYCQAISVEYLGLSPELESWLQSKIESNYFKPKFTIEQKRKILQDLNRSELFEVFLNTKYVGQKRFSLEGGETLIPILSAIIELGSDLGIKDFVLGMAHRGRLNVLSNILNKSYGDIFSEFDEHYLPNSFEGSGDVKYHKGFTSKVKTNHSHDVQISLSPNPSHLESVDPVVEGEVAAIQVLKNDLAKREHSTAILVHGDAAISGQGVVYETMQFCKLPGYSTGGTIHIVINNQIGFTTLPSDSRSTNYCTDIAATFGAPVFHVNAEHPEECVFAAMLAVEIRQKFHSDVFIDLNCYRKYGHNETDEPAYTQPSAYQLIRKKKPIREIYRDDLIQQGYLEKAMAEQLEVEFKNALQEALKGSKEQNENKSLESYESSFRHRPDESVFPPLETGVAFEELKQMAEGFSKIPSDFHIHPKLASLIKERLSMVSLEPNAKPVDWGMAETLAYASLLWNGTHVRISGQDCCRGTFSHRHAMWVDQTSEGRYLPLRNLREGQGRFDVYNSPLSEFAVLGFEFGYSFAYPNALVVWEAQFGDFCNGAQIIIDQYIATAEQKWGRKVNLVMFLPHGYEGQGPEHSSGRMERFLALAGDQNMVIINPSTPAQLFHMLRRHILMPIKKPLIVFTPKGNLRHPQCVNKIQDFIEGHFHEIIEDPNPVNDPARIVFCQGKIYYDLVKEREKSSTKDLLLVRVEQLYPLDETSIADLFIKYPTLKECLWVQEEPQNMGAWDYIQQRLMLLLPKGMPLKYIGRIRSASPAVGSHALHKKEHEAIMQEVFPSKINKQGSS